MPKISKVVATVWYDKAHLRSLRRVFPDAEFVYVDFYDKKKLVEETRDADVAILFGDVDSCILGENNLKWIHCDHAGLNGSARPEVFARGIPVTGSAGRSAPALAEHAIYFMLNHCYHTREVLDGQAMRLHVLPGSKDWRGLYGRKAGIIGMGHTGAMLADRLHALGMEVMAWNRSPISGRDYLEKLCGKEGDTIEPLLSACDFVILTVALNNATYHMLNKETIAQMKPGAFLVNMARGGLVDTAALTEALQSGHLSGAGLDVIEEDPLPDDHPLWDMQNVYMTPHVTPQIPDRTAASIEIIRENARRFEAGEPMMNLLTEDSIMTMGESKGGMAMMATAELTPELIEHVKKVLGEHDWTDPSEWM